MSVIINKAGFMTTVQDGGRPGFGHIGIPASGYMDRDSAHVANVMVSNDPDTPLLEVDVAGIVLTSQVACSVAVSGAKASVLVNQIPQNTDQTIHLKPDDRFEIKTLTGGMWCYLAFAGGIQCEPILGSCSTLLVAKLGGHEGRRLQKNDVLNLRKPANVKTQIKPRHKRPPHNTIHSLAALRGPEYDLFTQASRQNIIAKPFTMTENISRQGMKITGPKLATTIQVNLISSGLVPGSLQVTPAGECIITHRDSQTTGGYPRIIVLKRQTLNQLAQVRPGEHIYFYMDHESRS